MIQIKNKALSLSPKEIYVTISTIQTLSEATNKLFFMGTENSIVEKGVKELVKAIRYQRTKLRGGVTDKTDKNGLVINYTVEGTDKRYGIKLVKHLKLPQYGPEKRRVLREVQKEFRTQISQTRKQRRTHKLITRESRFGSISFPKYMVGGTNDKNSDVKQYQYKSRTTGKTYTIKPNNYVNVEAGTFIKMLNAKEAKMIFEPKSPKSNKNHVGIEIEFLCKANNQQVAIELTSRGIAKHLELKTDGSLRPSNEYPHAHELCIIAPEDEIQNVLKEVCEGLKKLGSTANDSCGLHVHLDMRNRDPKIAFHNLALSQGVLYKMVPESRATGTYSKMTSSTEMDEYKNASSKYLGINPLSYNRLKTLECRIHNGTVNFTKISNWVQLLVNIASRGTKLAEPTKGLVQFLEAFNISQELAEYIKMRVIKFKKETKDTED